MKTKKLFEVARKTTDKSTIENKATETAVKLSKQKDTLYVSLRETNGTFKDWFFNFWFCRKYGYHRGFLIKTLSIYPQLLKKLHKYNKDEINNIIVLGFSQGGATGAIVYKRFKKMFKDKNVEAHLFAAPRAFTLLNYIKDKDLFDNLTRYQISKDLVTKVPFGIFGFKHVGNEIKLKSNYTIFNVVDNHHPDTYEKLLAEKDLD